VSGFVIVDSVIVSVVAIIGVYRIAPERSPSRLPRWLHDLARLDSPMQLEQVKDRPDPSRQGQTD